jgi:L-asparaginase
MRKIVVLGTGGTIAGTAISAEDNIGYTAAQVGVSGLLDAIASLRGQVFETEQVAQIDSKDMGFDVWVRLAQRCAHWLAQN